MSEVPKLPEPDTIDDIILELRKQSKLRFRNTFLVLGTLLVIFLRVATSPDAQLIQQLNVGAGTVEMLSSILKAVVGIGLLYISGRAMMDYPAADFEKLGVISSKSAEGAGLYALAVSLKYIAYAIVIVGTYYVG